MLNPDYRDMLSAFSDEQVECLLVGAYALAVHGFPRATGDQGLWIRPSPENANRAWRALARTAIDGVEFEEAWPKRVEVQIEGLTITTIGREELIKNKRITARPQDVADIARLEEGT